MAAPQREGIRPWRSARLRRRWRGPGFAQQPRGAAGIRYDQFSSLTVPGTLTRSRAPDRVLEGQEQEVGAGAGDEAEQRVAHLVVEGDGRPLRERLQAGQRRAAPSAPRRGATRTSRPASRCRGCRWWRARRPATSPGRGRRSVVLLPAQHPVAGDAEPVERGAHEVGDDAEVLGDDPGALREGGHHPLAVPDLGRLGRRGRRPAGRRRWDGSSSGRSPTTWSTR